MTIVQRRIGGIFALFFCLLLLAGGRTLYLGALKGGSLRKAAATQQLTYEVVPAQRGTITDRNGVDLAVSEPAQDISATPYLIANPLAAAQKLAPLLGKPQSEVLRELSERSGFVYLARALPAKQAHEVLALKLEGIDGAPVMRRVYPRGALAAQVLGVGRHRRQRAVGARILAQRAASRARRRAPRRQRRARTAGLDLRTACRAVRHAGRADARREHPAANRRRARRGRARVQPERRDGDRDEPADRRDPGDGQLATGRPEGPRHDLAGRHGESCRQLRLRTRLDVQGRDGRRRAAAASRHAEHELRNSRPDSGRRPHDPR